MTKMTRDQLTVDPVLTTLAERQAKSLCRMLRVTDKIDQKEVYRFLLKMAMDGAFHGEHLVKTE